MSTILQRERVLAYQDVRGDIAEQIARINMLLAKHGKNYRKDPTNYGPVGDLEEVRRRLIAIREFIEGEEA